MCAAHEHSFGRVSEGTRDSSALSRFVSACFAVRAFGRALAALPRRGEVQQAANDQVGRQREGENTPLTKGTQAFPRELRARFPVREALADISISLRARANPCQSPRALAILRALST